MNDQEDYKDDLANGYISEIDNLVNFCHRQGVELIKENKKSSYLFNPLRNFDIGETKHSLILAKLLDQNGDHGQGLLFLEKFLSLQKIDIEVNKEEDNWSVTFETGKIDILIKRKQPPVVIVIENKSHNAKNQENQLYRYWFQEIFLPNKNRKYEDILKDETYKLIYLSRNEDKEPDLNNSLQKPQKDSWKKYLDGYDLPDKLEKEYITKLTFEKDIVEWLTNCLECLKENQRLHEFVKLYHDLIEEFSNSKIMENEKIGKTIEYFGSSEKLTGSEKWNSFTELADLKEEIIKKWYSKLYKGLKKKIIHSGAWKSDCWEDGIRWYLEDFESYSHGIWVQKEYISLWVSRGCFHFDLIKNKINTDQKYQPILGLLKDDKGFDNGCLLTDKGRYMLGNMNNFNSDQLAWFAGNQTDEIITQIELKLKPFFTKEITELIRDLNNLGKK